MLSLLSTAAEILFSNLENITFGAWLTFVVAVLIRCTISIDRWSSQQLACKDITLPRQLGPIYALRNAHKLNPFEVLLLSLAFYVSGALLLVHGVDSPHEKMTVAVCQLLSSLLCFFYAGSNYVEGLRRLHEAFQLGDLSVEQRYLMKTSWPPGKDAPASVIAAYMANETSTSPLLNLPGELRNIIYRYALLDDNPVPVTTQGYNRSSLLGTCRRIRRETFTLFYEESIFLVRTVDYNRDNLYAWKTLLRSGIVCPTSLKWMTMCSNRTPDWANVLTWARRRHEDRWMHPMRSPEALKAAGNRDKTKFALGAMFQMVAAMRDQPWPLVERTLVQMRPMLEAIDARWGQD